MQTVVIGSGVLGASTAYHLARGGVAVTVVDAALDGRASAAGAGIICPWVSGLQDPAFLKLYIEGGEYYPDLIARLAEIGETDTGYRRTGAILVARDQADLAWIESMAVRRRAASPAMGDVSRFSSGRTREMFPPLRPDLSGIHFTGGGRVDGRRLVAALLGAAERHGARVVRGTAEPRIEHGRVRGVDASGRFLPADTVVVTAGAWADSVLRPLGIVLPIEPQRGQIVHLQLADTATADWPVILPPGSHYIVPFDGGRVVIGATRETGAGFDYRVTAAGQAEVLAQALSIAPGLGLGTIVETRVGFRPVGAARPVFGWTPSIAGLLVGNGLAAAGLTIGPLAGRLLADLVMQRPALLDLAPFDPQREGEPAGNPVAALR